MERKVYSGVPFSVCIKIRISVLQLSLFFMKEKVIFFTVLYLSKLRFDLHNNFQSKYLLSLLRLHLNSTTYYLT